MLEALRSIICPRKRCGVCLFELHPRNASLTIDFAGDGDIVFLASDYHEFLFKDLVSSADRRCDSCQRILGALRRHGVDFIKAQWWPGRFGRGGKPYLELVEARAKFELCVATDYPLKGAPSLHPCISRGSRISGNTGDVDVIERAAEWLASCRNQHPGCRAKGICFRPTRLLFLGHNNPEVISLVERHNNTTWVPYAALSHRWSEQTQRARLEEGNFLRRIEHGIPLAEFPQMMRDVFLVLRRLGIMHAWVDCMCIIQDDKQDWRREAGAMASIYTHAELTVAATWCTSSGRSLFRNRDASNYATTDSAAVESRPIFFRRALPHFTWQDMELDLFANDDLVEPEREWPLLSRGWVYQEQLLSRRMLHFTRHELVWECNSATECECGWHASDDSSYAPLASRSKHPLASKTWSQIVKEYSKRDLTFAKDKLPALASIAETFGKQHPGEYLCGLWGNQLEQCFFWHLADPPGQRYNTRVPSWSWASVPGNVDCWQSSVENIEFLGWRVTYHGDAYMGEVKEAQLDLSGPVFPATLHHGQSWLEALKAAPLHAQPGPNSSPSDINGYDFGLEIDHRLATFQPDYALDGLTPAGLQVWCLSFGRVTSSSCDPEKGLYEEHVAACFLVLRCVDENKSLYERIGVCNGSGPIDGRLTLERVLGLSQNSRLTLV